MKIYRHIKNRVRTSQPRHAGRTRQPNWYALGIGRGAGRALRAFLLQISLGPSNSQCNSTPILIIAYELRHSRSLPAQVLTNSKLWFMCVAHLRRFLLSDRIVAHIIFNVCCRSAVWFGCFGCALNTVHKQLNHRIAIINYLISRLDRIIEEWSSECRKEWAIVSFRSQPLLCEKVFFINYPHCLEMVITIRLS